MKVFVKTIEEGYSYNDLEEDAHELLMKINTHELDVKDPELIKTLSLMLKRYFKTIDEDMQKYLDIEYKEAEIFWNGTTLKAPYKEDRKYERFSR